MIYNRKDNINLFEEFALANIHRRGIVALVDYLKMETDFFEAPASTKYHGAFDGGLLAHSLEVYFQFLKIAPVYNYDLRNPILFESASVVTLFHDVCKVGTYRKVKTSEDDFYYTCDPEGNIFGAHGARSLFMITQYMKLSDEEAMAIYHHMGQFDCSKYDNLSIAYEHNKLAWLLHVADEAATYIAGI